jgi:hypothetical protein
VRIKRDMFSLYWRTCATTSANVYYTYTRTYNSNNNFIKESPLRSASVTNSGDQPSRNVALKNLTIPNHGVERVEKGFNNDRRGGAYL